MRARATTTAFDDRLVDRAIDARYLETSRAATAYVAHVSAGILETMGFYALPGEPQAAGAIAQTLGVATAAGEAFEWLLRCSAMSPYVSSTLAPDGSGRYSPGRERPTDGAIRARRPPHPDGSTAMLEYAAAAYPAFLRGARSGAAILLTGSGLAHWTAYFSDANPLYDVHNQLAAAAVAAHLPTRPAARVLELGSGTGGASAAVARAIAGTGRQDGIAFTVSDVSRSFLASAVARVRPLVPSVRSLRIDFDRPLDDQEIAAASVDVVVAVNALHNAADIPRTLERIRAALSPGGVLVLSESLCGAGALVHQEFVFNLLGAPRHGARASRFLSADQWRQLLDDARLELAVQVNGRGPELAMLALARRAD